MSPQALLAVRAVVIFVAGIFASRGLISHETATYVAGPEAMAFVGGLAFVATGAWGLWLNRPHAKIKDVAALPQVDSVVVAPKTANEMQITNVVAAPSAGVQAPS